jgi:hypothetical protein
MLLTEPTPQTRTSILFGRIPYLALTPCDNSISQYQPYKPPPLFSRAHVLFARDHPLTAHDLGGNFLSSDVRSLTCSQPPLYYPVLSRKKPPLFPQELTVPELHRPRELGTHRRSWTQGKLRGGRVNHLNSVKGV